MNGKEFVTWMPVANISYKIGPFIFMRTTLYNYNGKDYTTLFHLCMPFIGSIGFQPSAWFQRVLIKYKIKREKHLSEKFLKEEIEIAKQLIDYIPYE